MLRIGKEIRFRLAAILLAHWGALLSQHRKWIRPVIFETVRKITACRTPTLGCPVYPCPNCQAGTQSFRKKVEVYKSVEDLHHVKKVMRLKDWNLAAIEKREKELMNFAKDQWWG